jgi:site-specific recombinase XerD
MAAPAPLHAGSSIEQGIALFLEYLEKERNYARHTLDAYRRDLQQFARFLYPRISLVGIPVNAVQREVVQSFVEELRHRGLRPNSVARKLAVIRSFFRHLCRQHVLADNPASLVGSAKPAQGPPRYLPLTQIEEAIALPPATEFTGARDRAIIEVFYGGGVRLSELVGLNLSALDLDEGTVRVMGKGRRERIVPIGGPALQTLKTYLQHRAALLMELDITQVEAGALFLNRKGRRLHRRTVQGNVKRYLRQVSTGQSLSPHLLRHTFATHMVEAGADLGAVKELLGHAVLSSTQVYTQVSLDRLRQIIQQAHPRA